MKLIKCREDMNQAVAFAVKSGMEGSESSGQAQYFEERKHQLAHGRTEFWIENGMIRGRAGN